MMILRRRSERGFILLVVLLILLILSLMGVATMYLAGTGNTLAISSRMDDQAFRAAEAGSMYAMTWAQNLGAATAQCLANSTGGPLPQGFSTVGFGGTATPCGITSAADVQILDNGATVPLAGATAGVNLHAAFQIYPSSLPNQPPVRCGLSGFSLPQGYGQYRFAVRSRGYGPGNTTRTIEAHVYLPPLPNLCNSGNNVATSSSYSGG